MATPHHFAPNIQAAFEHEVAMTYQNEYSRDLSNVTLRHLNQTDLARRWRISPRTLERWRWLKIGPPYVKIGGRVLYRIEDIEAYERAGERLTGRSMKAG